MDGHDRYLIYQLLGHHVEVNLPARFGDRQLSGVAERVSRDIFDDVIEVFLSGTRHAFREPDAIIQEGEEIVFLYGDVEDPISEEHGAFEAFNGYEESINEHLQRTSQGSVSKAVFSCGDLAKTSGERWRSRVALG